MNTTFQLSPLNRLKLAAERVMNSDEFGNIWVWTIIITGFGVPIAGLVGLVVWAVVAVALYFTGGFREVGQVGYLFAATVVLLGGFDAAISPLVWDGNQNDPEQPKMNLTLGLSFVSFLVTAVGAYVIFTGDLISAYTAALIVPIVNLGLFAIVCWSWFWQR